MNVDEIAKIAKSINDNDGYCHTVDHDVRGWVCISFATDGCATIATVYLCDDKDKPFRTFRCESFGGVTLNQVASLVKFVRSL